MYSRKNIKERSQLHKIIENELWVFGENYNGTPHLWSDKKIGNIFIELREKFFNYLPSDVDKNLIDVEAGLDDITDLFFFNDKEEVVIGFSPVEFPRTELLGLCQLGSQSYYVGQEPFFLFEVEQILNGENCPKFNKHKKAES